MRILQFSRFNRTHLLATLIVIVMVVFVIRLFDLQVLQHEHYAVLANQEQMRQLDIPATRGEIYVMDGNTPVKIVLNETVYTVFADPSEVKSANDVESAVSNIIGSKAVSNMSALLANTKSRYAVLARGVTSSEANRLKIENLAGVGFTETTQRVYPEGQLASQVLGFVNADGDGQYGIEGAINDELKGKDGTLKTVVDVRKIPLTLGGSNIDIPAENGKNVVLTIDRNVQSAAEDILKSSIDKVGAKTGSMIVMDPKTGKVLAMANYPTYDPESISSVKDISVFNNPIISSQYEPASVMKTIDFSTAIDKGVIEPDSTYVNTGSIKVDDAVINNASKNAIITGNITMQTALNWSLNTGAITAAERLGDGTYITKDARNIMYDYYRNHFHFGEKTGIELQGEVQGMLIPPDDVQGNAVRYANMTFGQGIDVTTLQMASAFSAVINGGVYHDPSIISGTIDDDGNYTAAKAKSNNRAISESTSAKMREMIHTVRQQFGYNSTDPSGYYIGGKTGTAQTIENGTYTFNQQTGTYAGFGGSSSSDPSYVIVVDIAKPNTQLWGTDAMVAFNSMSNWMINYLKLEPKG